MKTRKPSSPRFAICVDNAEYPASLELHKLYQVLPDEDAAKDGDVRIIDESGEDYLYPAEYFVVIEVPRQATQTLTKPRAKRAATQGCPYEPTGHLKTASGTYTFPDNVNAITSA